MPLHLLLAALLVSGLASRQTAAGDTPDLQGKLYRSVFVQGGGTLAAADLPALPPDVGERLRRYLERRSAFKSRLQSAAASISDVAVEAKKRRVESGIVAAIEAPGIEGLAADYVERATILHEWKEPAAGPLAEAAFAENFLKQNPSSPLAPYLYVFIAHRQRAAFEMMDAGTAKAAMTAASKKYRTFMQRARSADDRFFRLLADDLDRQPHVEASSPHHPRDFNPDT